MYMNLQIGKFKVRVEVLILIAVVAGLIVLQSTAACCSTCSKGKEGFTAKGNSFRASDFSPYTLGDDTPIDTSKMGMDSLVITPGQKPSAAAQAILNRPEQPVPLPEGQMAMFATTDFKPECCPNAYSNSSGCACMTVNQYNYLINRGGNNVPYSEY